MSVAVTPSVVSGKYRKLPALGAKPPAEVEIYPAAKEGKCARLTGHTLVMRDGKIQCQDCGATWVDEGF